MQIYFILNNIYRSAKKYYLWKFSPNKKSSFIQMSVNNKNSSNKKGTNKLKYKIDCELTQYIRYTVYNNNNQNIK